MNTAMFPEFHQIAIHVPDQSVARRMLAALGATEWISDEALLVGEVDGEKLVTKGYMSFNYTMLGGRELELLTYVGDNYHARAGRTQSGAPFLSHMSTHVSDAIVEGNYLSWLLDVPIVHSFETFNHKNPAIAGKKRFREVILGTRHNLGYDIKLIERITQGPWTYEE